MKVNEIKYTRRNNLGNYEHEEICVGVSVEDGDNASTILKQAISFVSTKGETDFSSVMVDPPAPKAKKETSVAKKETPKKVEEETKAEIKAEEKSSPVAEEEPKVEEKKATRVKDTPYDRSNELHKKLLSEYLDTAHKGWKSEVQKAVTVSIKMVGKPFLNSEGSIIKDFKESFSAEMGK
jgi:hypothetical protein